MARFISLAVTAGLAVSSLPAQLSIVLPNGTATAEGNTRNWFPLAWTSPSTAGVRVLTCYDSTNFTNQGINGPILIDGLCYRVDGNEPSWAGGFHAQATVALATAAVDYTSVTLVWANNYGPDHTIKHSGPITVQPGSASTPGSWYIDIPFASPFVYDPSGGDFIIETDLPLGGWNGPLTGGTRQHDVQTTGSMSSRVWSNPSYPVADGLNVNHGTVVQVKYTPVNALIPNFTADVTSGPSPLTVNFTDTSVTNALGGITGRAWDLDGDGTIDSTAQNPTFVYQNCGTFDVSLTVTDATNPPATETKLDHIRTDYVEVTPDFDWFAGLGGTPGFVVFSDTSSPTPTTWWWDFDGDGMVDSTLQNPTWQFPDGCEVRDVTLRVTRDCHGTWETTQLVAPSPRVMATNQMVNSGFSNTGSGNALDVDVHHASGVNISAIEATPGAGTAGPMTVAIFQTREPGGANGNVSNPGVWHLAALGHGTHPGVADQPTLFELDSALYLVEGAHALAVHSVNNAGLRDRLENNNWTPFVGNDLTITAGLGFQQFGGVPSLGRNFSGRLFYSVDGDGSCAGFGYHAPGCPGSLGVPTQTAAGPAQLGTTMTVWIDGLPVDVAVMLIGLSDVTSRHGPLPLETSGFGAPNCFLRVSPDVTEFVIGANNAASWDLGIPNNVGLIGLRLFTQAVVLDPGINAAGAIASDSWASFVGY